MANNSEPPTVTERDKELLSQDVLNILTLAVMPDSLDELLRRIVETVARTYNIRAVTIGLLDSESGLFRERISHGIPESTRLRSFTMQRMKYDLRPEFLIGRETYYVRPLDTGVVHDDDYEYCINPERVNMPRKSPDEWQELDYMDFVMTDHLGKWIGWLEINDPGDRKVPTQDVRDRIRALADIAAIAIENARLYKASVESLRDAEGYLDLIVHDIGNKMTPLRFYHEQLAKSVNLDSSSARRLSAAQDIARSISDLVQNVKKVAEIRSTPAPPPVPVDLAAVLRKCIASVSKETPGRQVDVTLDCPFESPRVIADELIHDLFANLLANAIRYDRSPVVNVGTRLTEEGNSWRVEIEDHGQGIPDDRKREIFDRFVKRPSDVGGTGLGLSIVSQLVNRYGGAISVRDRVQGDFTQGSCFEVVLPKAPQ